jgi:hypothetical protein
MKHLKKFFEQMEEAQSQMSQAQADNDIQACVDVIKMYRNLQ